MSQFMHKFLQLPFKTIKKIPLVRRFSTSKNLLENYEGDGKTTVTILNREHKNVIMFDSYSNKGFRLNNGIFILGPVAVFPRTILQWNVESIQSLIPECFSLFSVLEPKLDIFLLGTGNKRILPNSEVLNFLKKKKISIEVLTTEQACSTFNFLNAEGRYVAGGFLPDTELSLYEEEIKMLADGKVSPLPEKSDYK